MRALYAIPRNLDFKLKTTGSLWRIPCRGVTRPPDSPTEDGLRERQNATEGLLGKLQSSGGEMTKDWAAMQCLNTYYSNPDDPPLAGPLRLSGSFGAQEEGSKPCLSVSKELLSASPVPLSIRGQSVNSSSCHLKGACWAKALHTSPPAIITTTETQAFSSFHQ